MPTTRTIACVCSSRWLHGDRLESRCLCSPRAQFRVRSTRSFGRRRQDKPSVEVLHDLRGPTAAAEEPEFKIRGTRLRGFWTDDVADADDALAQDSRPQAAAMDQPAHHAAPRKVFQMLAWLTE